MRSNVKRLWPLGGVLLAACCGGGPTGSTTGQSTASVQISSTPSTLTYAVCPPSHCGPLLGQFEIEATLTLRETAGVAVSASRLALTIRRRSDNAAIANTDVVANSAPIRIAAGGTTPVPIAMHFDAAAAESNMKIVVVVEGLDANGHQVSASTEFEIRSP